MRVVVKPNPRSRSRSQIETPLLGVAQLEVNGEDSCSRIDDPWTWTSQLMCPAPYDPWSSVRHEDFPQGMTEQDVRIFHQLWQQHQGECGRSEGQAAQRVSYNCNPCGATSLVQNQNPGYAFPDDIIYEPNRNDDPCHLPASQLTRESNYALKQLNMDVWALIDKKFTELLPQVIQQEFQQAVENDGQGIEGSPTFRPSTNLDLEQGYARTDPWNLETTQHATQSYQNGDHDYGQGTTPHFFQPPDSQTQLFKLSSSLPHNGPFVQQPIQLQQPTRHFQQAIRKMQQPIHFQDEQKQLNPATTEAQSELQSQPRIVSSSEVGNGKGRGQSERGLQLMKTSRGLNQLETIDSSEIHPGLSVSGIMQQYETQVGVESEVRESEAVPGSVPNAYACPIQDCSRVFFVHADYRRHVPTHSKDQPFQCELCKMRFSRCALRTTHMRQHDQIKAYKCESCEIRFHTQLLLTKHTCPYSQTFKCGICNRGFRDSPALDRHRASHFKTGVGVRSKKKRK